MNIFRGRQLFQLAQAFSICLILVGQLSGCALKVKLVGEYDEIMDKAVTDLQKKTATFFAKLKNTSGQDKSYEANKGFYEDVQGDVAVLILRSQVIEKGLKWDYLTKNFKDLQAQYDDLTVLHRTSPPPKAFENAEKAFEQSFRAILEYLLYLKWKQTPPESQKQ